MPVNSQSFNQDESALLDQFRDHFYQRFQSNIQNKEYDQRDLDRLKDNNIWLNAFYKHCRGKNDTVVNLIDEVLSWRKRFGTNDLIQGELLPFPEELIKNGGLFYRNQDKKGNQILNFVVKLHRKENFPFNEVCKYIAYHFEKSYKFDWNYQIVLLFDMVDAGLGNLDMEMIKFVINCLKIYYPGLIDYMLIFQMPFIFNAAWKIVKNWLPPEAVQLIKFVDKKSIKEYIDDSQLFKHMGGLDDYKYKYDPVLFHQQNDEMKKRDFKVSFASLPDAPGSSSMQLNNYNHATINGKFIPKSQSEIIRAPSTNSNGYETLDELNETLKTQVSNEKSENKAFTSPLLSIIPGDEIVFNLTEAKADVFQYINITNTSEAPLAFKIKITSPDKFRVKPGSGIIPASTKIQISINFLKDFHNQVSHHRDKFLFLWTPVESTAKPNDLPELWKQLTQNKATINEHKLKCVIVRSNADANGDESQVLNADKVSPLQNESSSSLMASVNAHSLNSTFNANHSSSKNNSLDHHNSSTSTTISALTKTNNSSPVASKNLGNDYHELKKNLEEITKANQRLNTRISSLSYLIIFTIFLNLIQLLLQSNFYNDILEPYIDSIFFDRN